MIKDINAIATPYTATASKTNDVSTLDATEWNNISSAVATAHSKINLVISEASETWTSNNTGNGLTSDDIVDAASIVKGVLGSSGGVYRCVQYTFTGTLDQLDTVFVHCDLSKINFAVGLSYFYTIEQIDELLNEACGETFSGVVGEPFGGLESFTFGVTSESSITGNQIPNDLQVYKFERMSYDTVLGGYNNIRVSGQTIYLRSSRGVQFDNSDIIEYYDYDQDLINQVAVSDIYKVIEYFKTNNSTGPFAV